MLDRLLISLGYRWNNYKNCQRKAETGEDHMQKYLHDHYFSSENHVGLLNNAEITLIDKTDPSDPERREEFWRTKLHILALLGLNIVEQSIYYIASLF